MTLPGPVFTSGVEVFCGGVLVVFVGWAGAEVLFCEPAAGEDGWGDVLLVAAFDDELGLLDFGLVVAFCCCELVELCLVVWGCLLLSRKNIAQTMIQMSAVSTANPNR